MEKISRLFAQPHREVMNDKIEIHSNFRGPSLGGIRFAHSPGPPSCFQELFCSLPRTPHMFPILFWGARGSLAPPNFVKLPEKSDALINSLGLRNVHLPDNLIVATLLFKNDLIVLKSLLEFGLDPNGKILPETHIVNLCATVEAFQLLIAYGLDLTRNSPLLRVPFPVFLEMISRYNVNPWRDYELIDDFHKLSFLNPILVREREELSKTLRGTGLLIGNLSDIVINCVFPSVRSFHVK